MKLNSYARILRRGAIIPNQPLPGFVRIGYLVLAFVLSLPLLAAVGICSYFWLSSDADALRDSFVSSVHRDCHRKVVLNVGGFTTSFARFGLGFLNVPPEARLAAKSIHGAEVAVYRLDKGIQAMDRAGVLNKADAAMNRRGLERVVGVSNDSELVAVYVPRRMRSPEKVRCFVLAVHDQDAVIVGARGNLLPMMDLVRSRWDRELARLPGRS